MGGKLIYNEDNSFSYKVNSSVINSGYEAEGHRCKLINNKLADKVDFSSLYEGIIEESEYEPGGEVYVIYWRSGLRGCYDLGWIVVFDVEELISKVFKRDIVTDIVSSSPKATRFMNVLDEFGIRYGEDWTRID